MTANILFFDSGIGGLNIYNAVAKILPNENYLYVLDNAYFPYSELTEEVIIQRVLTICQQIASTYPLDLIVIACNTASTIALPALRQNFTIPIVGTVPAIKPAVEHSISKEIGLLATKGTIKRNYIQKLIDDFAADCKVHKLGSTELVKIAEKKFYQQAYSLDEIKATITTWLTIPDLDVIVLGCTHFPWLSNELQQLFPNVTLIDPSPNIANQCRRLLQQENNNKPSKLKQNNLMFVTSECVNYQQLQQRMIDFNFQQLSILAV